MRASTMGRCLVLYCVDLRYFSLHHIERLAGGRLRRTLIDSVTLGGGGFVIVSN